MFKSQDGISVQRSNSSLSLSSALSKSSKGGLFSKGGMMSKMMRSGGGDSGSDDDEESASMMGGDDDNTMGKGIVSFPNVVDQKSGKAKTVTLYMYNGKVSQISNRKKRVFSMEDINMVRRDDTGKVVVDIRQTLQVKQKKYKFNDTADAKLFKQYIDFYNDRGFIVRNAFTEYIGGGIPSPLVSRKTIQDAFKTVRQILNVLDIDATEKEVADMTMTVTSDGDRGDIVFQYEDFLNMLIGSQVLTARECFEEWLLQVKSGVTMRPEGAKFASLQDDLLDALPGEETVESMLNVKWTFSLGKSGTPQVFSGNAHLTTYRLVLITSRHKYRVDPTPSRYEVPSFFDLVTIPLCSFYRVFIKQPNNTLVILTKDNRELKLNLSSAVNFSVQAVERILTLCHQNAFVSDELYPTYPKLLFAFRYNANFVQGGWVFSDLRREYMRMNLTSPDWSLIDNTKFELVPTYPSWLIVPKRMVDQSSGSKSNIKLLDSIHHRSKNRFPAVTFMHSKTRAVLSRSAQPLSGLSGSHVESDRALLNYYRLKGKGSAPDGEGEPKFYIFDARRQIAAQLNAAQGKGTENAKHYTNTDLIYCDIDNIHVMRTSYAALGELLQPGGVAGTFQLESGKFLEAVDRTGWLKHVRLILVACYRIAEKMHFEGASVLVHCSDGWDRTAQLCSLTQILVDPYYRTFEGLASVIEKEWCAFGHKFNERCGHGEDHSSHSNERSPVFIQFLDSLFQVMNQCPTAFEYSEDLLLFLADHVHSGLFGTFLGNCMKQRMNEYECMDYTQSIWSYVFDNKDKYGMFLNKNYIEHKKPIWPSLGMGKVVLWERFHLRWDPEFHPRICSGVSWHDDWGLGKETLASNETAEVKRESDQVIRLRANTKKDSEDGYQPELFADSDIPVPVPAPESQNHRTMANETIEEGEEEEEDEEKPTTVSSKSDYDEAAKVIEDPAPAPAPVAVPEEPAAEEFNLADWEEKFSDKHNRKFWRNRRTGEKTWKNPFKGLDAKAASRKSQLVNISEAAQLAAQAAQMKLDA